MRQSLQQLAIQYGQVMNQQSVKESLTLHRQDHMEVHQYRREQERSGGSRS